MAVRITGLRLSRGRFCDERRRHGEPKALVEVSSRTGRLQEKEQEEGEEEEEAVLDLLRTLGNPSFKRSAWLVDFDTPESTIFHSRFMGSVSTKFYCV